MAPIKWLDPIQSPLLSQRDRRFMELARRQAIKSNFLRKQVGVVIVKGNRVVASGFNHLSHPMYLQYGGIDGLKYWSLHAEIDCLSAAPDVRKATAYLCAYKKKRFGNSEPCPLCKIYLKKRGIKRVVFSTPFGGIGEELYD